MSRHIIVVDRMADFCWPSSDDWVVMRARDYVAEEGGRFGAATRVINLCRDYSYLSLGYYCSLLAEARGHRVIPSTEVMLDLHWKRLLRIALPEVNALIRHTFKVPPKEQPPFAVDVFFRTPTDPRLTEASRRIFELFRSPILTLDLRFRNGWEATCVRPKSIRELDPDEGEVFVEALRAYTHASWRAQRRRPERYAIAILHDPDEALPPSDPKALRKFARAGARLGANVELITRADYTRLLEFDALFIRETTALDHHTYRFAKKAETEGMVVIDDPRSIVRCTNKIFLHELLSANAIPTPRAAVVDRRRLRRAAKEIGFPLVIKVPDSAFSRGVFRVTDENELARVAKAIFKESDLVIVQEFMATEFDWRIGVLAGVPLYACQYFMAKGHWQIVKHESGGGRRLGTHRTFALGDVPAGVLDAATRAASLVGDGLYGVDVKRNAQGVYVIEVNDNPNLDAGVEDGVLRNGLYEAVIGEIIGRLDQRGQRLAGGISARAAVARQRSTD